MDILHRRLEVVDVEYHGCLIGLVLVGIREAEQSVELQLIESIGYVAHLLAQVELGLECLSYGESVLAHSRVEVVSDIRSACPALEVLLLHIGVLQQVGDVSAFPHVQLAGSCQQAVHIGLLCQQLLLVEGTVLDDVLISAVHVSLAWFHEFVEIVLQQFQRLAGSHGFCLESCPYSLCRLLICLISISAQAYLGVEHVHLLVLLQHLLGCGGVVRCLFGCAERSQQCGLGQGIICQSHLLEEVGAPCVVGCKGGATVAQAPVVEYAPCLRGRYLLGLNADAQGVIGNGNVQGVL